jgi:hypothetical protein
MSLPPPTSATPRSVAPREDPYANPNDNRIHHRPSVASKKSIPEMGPPSTVTSYQLSSVEPATPYTPQALDTSRIQPSLQYRIKSMISLNLHVVFFSSSS